MQTRTFGELETNSMASATATPSAYARTTTSPAATLYWRVSGIALAAVAALGILMSAVGLGDLLGGFLSFDWTHNVVHVLLAALALGIGFSSVPATVSKGLAKVVGVVYVGLGVVGFFAGAVAALDGLLGLHLEIGENLVHLAIGAWGLYAGFGSD